MDNSAIGTFLDGTLSQRVASASAASDAPFRDMTRVAKACPVVASRVRLGGSSIRESISCRWKASVRRRVRPRPDLVAKVARRICWSCSGCSLGVQIVGKAAARCSAKVL